MLRVRFDADTTMLRVRRGGRRDDGATSKGRRRMTLLRLRADAETTMLRMFCGFCRPWYESGVLSTRPKLIRNGASTTAKHARFGTLLQKLARTALARAHRRSHTRLNMRCSLEESLLYVSQPGARTRAGNMKPTNITPPRSVRSSPRWNLPQFWCSHCATCDLLARVQIATRTGLAPKQ